MPQFTGKPGDGRASPLQMVPAYGSNFTRRSQSLTGTLTSTGTLARNHFYGFTQVSITVFRAVFRAVRLALRSPYRATILADTPDAYLRLDEASGLFLDASGNGHNGTGVGGLTTSSTGITGDGNSAVTFNGTTGVITLSPNIPTVNKFSLEVWLNSSRPLNSNVFDGVIGALQDAVAFRSPFMYVYSYPPAGQHLIHAGFGFGSGQEALVTSSGFQPSTWAHIVVTYDGTIIKAYINGVVDATTQTVTHSSFQTPIDQIGRMGASAYFPGILDEVAVYGYALNAVQILNHYNVGRQVKANIISVQRTAI